MLGRVGAVAGLLAASWSVIVLGEPATEAPRHVSDEATSAVMFVQFVAEDARARPIANLKASEINVLQDGRRQSVLGLASGATDGVYELRYAPDSGKAGAVLVRSLRPGSNVRAPTGRALKPRFVPAPTPLEAQLARLVDTDAAAADIECSVKILEFEAAADGLHHTFAVEVPLDGVGSSGRLQLLTVLRDAQQHVLRRYSLEQPVGQNAAAHQRLVWTSDMHLLPGRYSLQAVVRDAASSRKTVRSIAFDVAAAAPTVRLSSVILLRPGGALIVRPPAEDDPLLLAGTTLMPTFDLALPAASGAVVRFLVTLYPDAKVPDPPSLELHLRRGETNRRPCHAGPSAARRKRIHPLHRILRDA